MRLIDDEIFEVTVPLNHLHRRKSNRHWRQSVVGTDLRLRRPRRKALRRRWAESSSERCPETELFRPFWKPRLDLAI